MGGRERPCAGIPSRQTRRRCNWPKREAPLRGLPVRRETECPCARALSRRPPRACRFAEEQSAPARRPAFRRAACAGIPCGQTRRQHGWPRREATLVRGPAFRRVACAGIPCGQTRRRHGLPKREAPLRAATFARQPVQEIPRGQTCRRHGWPKREATLARGHCLADRRAPAGSPRNRAPLRAACLSPRSCAVHRKTEPCCGARIFRRENRLSRARKRGCCGRFVGKSDDRSVSPRYL